MPAIVRVQRFNRTAAGLGATMLLLSAIGGRFRPSFTSCRAARAHPTAEHVSAVLMAARNKMDAAMSIAVGASTQIALFVAPVLVFASYVIAPAPMDLLFTVFEVVAVALAVLTISLIAHDGETHWMEGGAKSTANPARNT